jgi:hypothetical protein
MNDDWSEKIWEETVVVSLWYSLDIYLEVLGITKETSLRRTNGMAENQTDHILIQAGSGGHTPSYPMGTGAFSRG